MSYEVNLGSYKYDASSRRREMQSRLESELEKVSKRLMKSEWAVSATSTSQQDKGKGDPLKMEIEGYVKDVEELRKESDGYEGPCFTKFLRILLSKGADIQTKLDKIATSNRDEIREEKKKLISNVEIILKAIKSKAHANACHKCEITHV